MSVWAAPTVNPARPEGSRTSRTSRDSYYFSQAEKARLNATNVQAAIAERDVTKAKAEGDAASVLEEGKARAASIECIGQAIQKHPDALKVMLVEMMPSVVKELSACVNNMSLGDVTVIDSGNGQAVTGAAMSRARTLSESLATLESILGFDIRDLTQTIAGNITKPNGSDTERRPSETSVA